MLKKDKTALSIYIENNLKYLKLFGNQRYNQSSPTLFVQDYKSRMSEKKMGLVPIPVKRNRTKLVNNYYKLYNLQRSIVMVRRYQYGRNNFGPAPTSNKAYDIALIQRWWKKMAKIITIQKNFRGYFIRKQVESILNLHRFMDSFENFLISMKMKICFDKIYRKTVISIKRKTDKGYYICKNRFYMSIKNLNKILMIQKNFRILKARNKFKRLLREQKFTVVNKFEFVSKINYNMNNIIAKIIKIQNNIKTYLKNKHFIERKIIHKDIGIYYFDKIYINYFCKRVISFDKLMRHSLQLLAIKKLRSKYKRIDEYNEDDINRVILIQNKYLKYYYNKNIIKRMNTKKSKKICFVDKLRLQNDINRIKLIQKIYRKYNVNKINFNQKLIKNKPISSILEKSKENHNPEPNNYINNKNNNIPKNYNNKINIKNIKGKKNKNKNDSVNDNINDKIVDNNDKIINKICYISKESKINEIKKVILLQTKIYSFLFLKNLKFQKRVNIINKNEFNKNFMITKIYSNENDCINKIKKIQNLYKKEFKYMKNNIIEYINTKSSNDSEISNKDKNENNYKNNINIKNYKDKKKNNNSTPKKKNENKKNKLPPIGNKNNIDILKNKNIKESPKFSKNNNINIFPKDKYYTKYNKNYIPNDIPKKNESLSQNKNKNKKEDELLEKTKNNNDNIKTLRELLKKNKTPKKESKGNYISKKRVQKNQNENYLNFNTTIPSKIVKDSVYISKKRYYNNDNQIKKIQKFWRKILKLNIIKKPIINILEEENNKEQNFEQEKKKNRYNHTPRKRNKLPYIKQNTPNTNSDYYNNSNKQNILPNTYDNDESYEHKNNSNIKNINYDGFNFIYKKNDINKNLLDNNILSNSSNIDYISKIRKIDFLKHVLLLQKNFRDTINKNKYLKKINFNGLILSKDRINIKVYNKFIETMNESKKIIKIPKQFNGNKNNRNNISDKISNINMNTGYISKTRYSNYIYYIEKIQANWRLKNKSKLINKRLRVKKCIITIKRLNNNAKEILKIQKKYRERIFKKNQE